MAETWRQLGLEARRRGGHAARLPVPADRRDRGGRRGGHDLAVHRQHEPGARHAGAGARPRSISPGIQVGQRITVTWRGKPVFIDHRTPEEIKAARAMSTSPTCATRRPTTSARSRSPNGWSWSASAPISAASRSARSRATRAATTAAGSARATARSTTPPAASARARRRSTWSCRPTNSPPTPCIKIG